jgi:hypothetical protein
MKAFARLVVPVPGQDHPIKLQNLLLQAEQLSAERGKTLTPTRCWRGGMVPRIVRLAAPPASSETKTGHDPPKESIIFFQQTNDWQPMCHRSTNPSNTMLHPIDPIGARNFITVRNLPSE